MSEDHALLLAALEETPGPALLVADENCLHFPFHALPEATEVLSNRFDVAERARAAGAHTRFSDFDLAPWPDQSLALVACRLSKEKASMHYLANGARRALATGGRLVLTGGKGEGIKSYAHRIGGAFGDGRGATRKRGALYQVECTKRDATAPALPDDDYPRLRPVGELNGRPLYSKPGIFGWDRVDAGSRLLADALPAFLADSDGEEPRRLLDLGCGYGYLGLAAARLGDFVITATDNNAAALIACRHNFREHDIAGRVIADDAGAHLAPGFDLVLCNPPFHQGFRGDRALTEKFLDAARRLLGPGGRALFVVNAFVPLEKLAGHRFRSVVVVRETPSFKVVALTP